MNKVIHHLPIRLCIHIPRVIWDEPRITTIDLMIPSSNIMYIILTLSVIGSE